MGLRARTLVILGLTLVCLYGLTYAFSRSVLVKGFAEVEEREARVNAGRVQQAIQNEVETVSIKMGDWSAWDDTYQYVQDGNKAFEISNLTVESLITLKLNFMMLLNRNNKLVGGFYLDFDDEKIKPLPAEVSSMLISYPKLAQFASLDTKHDGLLVLGKNKYFVTAQPIRTSKNSGPIMGTLIAGRLVTL